MAITAETRQDIIELVVTAFNAAPGTTLLNELVAIADAGSIADVAAFLTNHSEWSSRYPAFQTAEEFAAEWLGNLVPEASAAALAEAKDTVVGLVNGGASFADIILAAQSFLSAASEDDASFGTSAANWNNKVEVATTYTVTNESAALSTDVLSGVTSDDATTEGAGAVAASGQNLTLSTGIDAVSGGTGDDSASGTIGNAEPTITAGDSITLGDGADTFQVISTGTTGTVAGVTLSGVETIRVSDTSTGATTINLAGQTGITDLQSFGSANTGTLTFSNVGAIADLTLSNTSSTAATTVSYASAATTGTNTQNIALDNAAGTADTTIAGVEVFNISASSAGRVHLAASSATTVNVDSASNLTVDLDATGNTKLATVSAGESTGKITYILDFDNSVEMSVTGGAGDDTFDVTAGTYGLNDVLDGGEGEDTVRLQGTADIADLGAIGATGASFSNIEKLSLVAMNDSAGGTAADYTVDMDDAPGVVSISAHTTDVSTASAVTLNDLTATQAGAITLSQGAGSTGITLTTDLKDGTGTADEATVTAATAAGGTITIDDNGGNGAIEKLTVNVVGDHNQTIAIGTGDFAGTTAGQGSLTITGGGAGRTMTITNAISADTIDMSGVKSHTTLTAATGVNHNITGGTGDDDITFTTGLNGSDVIDLGDGNDRVIITPSAGMTLSPTITNVEELEIGASATVTLQVGSVTVPEIILTAQNGVTNVVTLANSTGVTNILAAAASGAGLDDANGLTFAGAGYSGTDDTVTITLSTVQRAMSTGAMTLNGIENINIVVSGDGDEDTATINGLTNNAINTMTVTSSGFGATTTGTDIVLGSVGDGANGMTSFDASGADTGVSVTLADMAASSSVTGSAYRDTIDLTGSAGGAIVSAGGGNDILTAAAGGDTIYGEGGNDTLNGAGGADTLSGGAGNDIIDGNAGADTITTGTGIDTIIRNGDGSTDGSDTITDFTAGTGGDIIDLQTNGAEDTDTGSEVTTTSFGTIAGATTGLANGITVVNVTYTGDLTAAAVATDLAAESIVSFADGEVSYIIIDNGTDTAIFEFADAGTAAIAAGELTLMVTLSGVSDATTLTAANFADFI